MGRDWRAESSIWGGIFQKTSGKAETKTVLWQKCWTGKECFSNLFCIIESKRMCSGVAVFILLACIAVQLLDNTHICMHFCIFEVCEFLQCEDVLSANYAGDKLNFEYGAVGEKILLSASCRLTQNSQIYEVVSDQIKALSLPVSLIAHIRTHQH